MSHTTKRHRSKFPFTRAHRYYKLTGFYSFVTESIKKSMPPVLAVVALLAIVHFLVMPVPEMLEMAVQELPDYGVLAFFYVSETFLGLIPPELFIAWSGKTAAPILNLSLLALFSYLGGMTAYFIGRKALQIPSVHYYLEVKMAKQLVMARKWGGILIAVGALLPLPFSISSLVAGMLKYDFKWWCIIGLLRFIRFVIYGAAIFQVV
ncbi:YqaA family protein [Nonlabens sp.]|uniref:YqaA family protein n=1 Tax=Nonlabens sp. TaxID=1888209 RepID=UPI003F6A0897